MSSGKPVNYIASFKVPKEEVLGELLSAHEQLLKEAKKDGKPYVLSCNAGPTGVPPGGEGYNFVAHSTFASHEDIDYHNNSDPLHLDIIARFKTMLSGPPLILIFQDTLNA